MHKLTAFEFAVYSCKELHLEAQEAVLTAIEDTGFIHQSSLHQAMLVINQYCSVLLCSHSAHGFGLSMTRTIATDAA